MQLEVVFQIAVLIMSVVIHEVSHGYAAYLLGDPTAKYEGRLTLNPLKHLDMVGSVIVPLVSYYLGGFIFGWAKPVPYNPYNLRPGRWSEAKVALAGPASNLALALIFGLFLRIGLSSGSLSDPIIHITGLVVFINILLAIFNLVPLPPLDGSKLLFALFPEKTQQFRRTFEQYGFLFVLIFIFFFWQLVSPVIAWIFSLITGLYL
jgi:Zn-dependent protease